MAQTRISEATLPLRMKAFYELVSIEQDKALARAPSLFTEDVRWFSPIGDRSGLEAFLDSWRDMFRRYESVKFQNLRVDGDDAHFVLTYEMSVKMRIGKPLVSPMATEFYGRDGKVDRLRDYFDAVGSLFTAMPLVEKAYQKVMYFLLG